jgi:hypothetical protein
MSKPPKNIELPEDGEATSPTEVRASADSDADQALMNENKFLILLAALIGLDFVLSQYVHGLIFGFLIIGIARMERQRNPGLTYRA